MKKRVLQVFNQYRERGGEEKSALRIFQHGQEVCEIERLWWDSRSWDAADGPGTLGQLRRLFYNPDSAAELREKIREFRPDVLLCHNLYPIGSPAVYHVAKKEGIPVIQYVHNFRPFSVGGSLWNGRRVAEESLQGDYRSEIWNGSWQDSRLRSALFACLLKGLHASGWLQSVKRWICISEFMKERFIEAGLPEGNVMALRHSWDTKALPADTEDEGYYLFLSRLVPEKGVLVLLDAWDALVAKMGDKAPVLKIGGVGSLLGEVERRGRQNPKIEVMGFVEGGEKARLVEKCRAMLAPSIWWEPLGLVTYESYEAGKPMLAAASGGLTETVQDGVTGFLHEPGEVDSLVQSVLRLEKCSPDERAMLGDEGRRWLLEQASPSEWKSRFREIVEGAVSNA